MLPLRHQPPLCLSLCALDGDRDIGSRGERRAARGIDTPELRGKCASEKERAIAAREHLRMLLVAGPVELSNVEPDKYAGRVDATVRVSGQDIGAAMVAAGHARPYNGGARAGWCP